MVVESGPQYLRTAWQINEVAGSLKHSSVGLGVGLRVGAGVGLEVLGESVGAGVGAGVSTTVMVATIDWCGLQK